MKTSIIAPFSLLVTFSFSAQSIAADNHESSGSHGVMHTPITAEIPLVEGLVKKVDKLANKVTLSHGPLPNGMPGMTMVFHVKEVTWIDRMKEGQKIRFAADQVDGAMTVVRFEPIK